MTRLPAAGFTTLLSVTMTVAGAAACSKPPAPAPPTKVLLTTVWIGSPWGQIGQALTTASTHRLTNVSGAVLVIWRQHLRPD